MHNEKRLAGKFCCKCGNWCLEENFSSNQWSKAQPKCPTCVRLTHFPIRCVLCPSRFACKRLLEEHKQNYHHICEKCDQIFDIENDLIKHTKTYPSHKMVRSNLNEQPVLCQKENNQENSCPVCSSHFKNENNLRQHMKVHRSRQIACPVCGEQRFACSANAVAHVEMGACSGCRGKAAARKRIYEFVSHNAPQLRVPMIENGYQSDDVPEYPYYCHSCQRSFRHLSALMNHEEDVHKQSRKMMRLT